MEYPMRTKIVRLIEGGKNDEYYIFGKGKSFIIPEYQREYSWDEEQIEEFMTSISNAVSGKSVFMGTVQFHLFNDKKKEYHIIDGQQRMTTFCLLFNLLDKKSGLGILIENNIKFEIRNFESNNKKLKEAIDLKYDEIDNADPENNRYIKNLKILKSRLEEMSKDGSQSYTAEILKAVLDRIYFVELTTYDIPLPDVVGIFNTINTTGLELNCTDLFKLQYYEYLRKEYPDGETNNSSWMRRICDTYEEVNKNGCDMSYILDIFKYCIVARSGLALNMLSKNNETFFQEIFGAGSEVDNKAVFSSVRFKKSLSFDEFENISKLYIDFSNRLDRTDPGIVPEDDKLINVFAIDITWMSRYRKYWILPYIAAYFDNSANPCERYRNALEKATYIAKYLIVCSINFDKVINPVQTFMCNEILPALSRNESSEYIKNKISQIICEAPYGWHEDYPKWNSSTFKKRLREDLFHNSKRSYIVCTLSALLEEIKELKSRSSEEKAQGVIAIRKKLFNWKYFQYDTDHICARALFEKQDNGNLSEYNGIGNLVVLNRSINRSIGDMAPREKASEYKNSDKYRDENEYKFVSVAKVADDIENSKGVWGICQIRKRSDEQVTLLCDFLGLR